MRMALFVLHVLAVVMGVQAELTGQEREAELKKVTELATINAGIRGFIQGLKRGFYNRKSVDLSPQCFGSESVIQEYEIANIWNHQDFNRFYEIPGKLYSLWVMLDQECQTEELIYDFWLTCRMNNCDPEKIIKNDADNIFQLTGILNSAAVIYSTEIGPNESPYSYYYEELTEVGKDLGKLMRISFGFQP